jgi:hypothetical protein
LRKVFYDLVYEGDDRGVSPVATAAACPDAAWGDA